MSEEIRNGRPTTFSRRQVLGGLLGAGVVTIVGTSPLTGAMRAFAVGDAANDRVLVNVFLRGAADGLNIVVPHADDDYYRLRSTIAQPRNTLTDLDGFFGLHQSFNPLYSMYEQGELAFIHATGSHALTRSHFTAMDNMDLAFGNTGWMQRVLAAEQQVDPVSGFTIGPRTSPSLRGQYGGLAYTRLHKFRSATNQLAPMRPTLESMYAGADPLLSNTTLRAFASIDTLQAVDPSPASAYPNTGFGRDLREAAALIKANIGVRMVSVNFGGWDHHSDETPRLELKGAQLAEGLAAFKADLGAESGKVLTMVMSEFGRTAEENGSGGTDHGHGNMMMLMGGNLANAGGGKVHLANDRWVGLSSGELHAGRDLAVSTDFRSVLAEGLDRHLGFTDFSSVFGGFAPQYLGYLDTGTGGPPTSTTTTTLATTTTVGPPTTESTTTTTTGDTTTTTTGDTTTTTGDTTTTTGDTTTTTGDTTTTTGPSSTTTTTRPGPPTPTGSVSGRVVYTGGGGAAGVLVDLFGANADGTRGQWLGDARTDGAGDYRFSPGAGSYILTFVAPADGRFVGGRQYVQPTVKIEPGRAVTGVNAQLVSGGPDDATIGGTVSDEKGAAAGVTVDLFLASGDGSRGLWLGDAISDSSGRYRFGVQPGCYVLTFIAPPDRRFANGGPYYQPSLCVDEGQVVTDVDATLLG